MVGQLLRRHHTVDGPFPTDETRVFAREDVAAFGKVRRYGDFVTRYIVRLRDGAELFVTADKQDASDRKWIRALARKVERPAHPVSRDAPIRITWLEGL